MNRAKYCVTEAHTEAEFAWNALAPFSDLAHHEQGLNFFKRLRNEPQQLHAELALRTEVLTREINGKLPCIVSIADPYASERTISEDDMKLFSLPYLFQMLRGLRLVEGGAVHVCPYCSERLERHGFAHMELIRLPSAAQYEKVLSDYAKAEHGVLLGGQCIHTNETDCVFVLRTSADGA
ncbi:MAG: hypothetical protein LBT44_00575 [Clostridiales bacterium]|nr:hypothetical protein [Clostridiales bacterium]